MVIRPNGPSKFTLLAHDGGLTLCDSFSGAVFTISYPEELEQVRELLTNVEIKRPQELAAADKHTTKETSDERTTTRM